jgi:hypothetical protein
MPNFFDGISTTILSTPNPSLESYVHAVHIIGLSSLELNFEQNVIHITEPEYVTRCLAVHWM